MEQILNAADVIPAGSVRHIVTTYTMSPALRGNAAPTLDQWFGNVQGRLTTRQTGLMGETVVLDASGIRWTAFPGTNEVLKLSGGPGDFPMLTPNRVALDSIGAGGSQPRVTGHTTVNGRAATILELVRSWPALSDQPPGAQPGAGVAVGAVASAPGKEVFAFSRGSGSMVVAMSPQGGTVVSELVVDDQTHQILRGHAVSKDPAGNVVGTTDWAIVTDALVDASLAPADLFVFTPAPGTTVREPAPGAPFQIRIAAP